MEVHHAFPQAGHPPPDGARHEPRHRNDRRRLRRYWSRRAEQGTSSTPLAPPLWRRPREYPTTSGSRSRSQSRAAPAGSRRPLPATAFSTSWLDRLKTGTGAWHLSFSWSSRTGQPPVRTDRATGSTMRPTAKSVDSHRSRRRGNVRACRPLQSARPGDTPDLKVYLRGTFLSRHRLHADRRPGGSRARYLLRPDLRPNVPRF